MMKKILLFSLFIITFSPFAQSQSSRKNKVLKPAIRAISVDYSKVKGSFSTMYKECIGAGRANEGLRADWQKQLTYVKDQCDFKYIRMHGLLTDDMGLYMEDKSGKPIYNFQYIDELYDFLLSIKIKPFVELGFMPEALASGRKTMFWWRGNITPPKDYHKWEELIRHLVAHFKERYGEEEVKTWYFEVWNEPNLKDLFFTGDMNEYFKLYSAAAKAIKEVSKVYKVGGPATAGSAWIPEFIDYCAKNKVPVDFVSTHTYGVASGFVDVDGHTGTILDKKRSSVYGEVRRSRKEIQASAIPNLELHYTEWSSSYTPTDPLHDSYHEAAFILDKIKNAGDAPNSMSYWVFTDIFEENGPRTTPFHGGFGLLNYQSINKPAFYSYQFLNKLGDTELENTDSASWVCKNKQGDIQALFWDFTITSPEEDSINNQIYYKRELPARPKGSIKLKINNIPAGGYLAEVFKVGYRSNDAYAAYVDLGSPDQLTKKEVEAIKNLSNGGPITTKVVYIDEKGNLEEDFQLRENDVFLVTLKKLK